MDYLFSDIFKGAYRLVSELAGVKPHESVLVIADTKSERYGTAVVQAASALAKEVSYAIIPTYTRVHGMNPPRPIAEAMKHVDVCIMPTEWSMSHCSARRDASGAGVRCLTVPTPDDDIFARTMVESPFAEMEPITKAVNQALSDARHCRVRTPGGTDLWVDLTGRKNVDLQTGYCLPDPIYCNFSAPPVIEANIAPLEGTAEGVVVVDAAQSAVGLVKDPIRLTVRKGRIVEVEGREEASVLRQRMDAVGDPDIACIAEVGIGLNPKARMRGRFIEDEAVYGTGHFGMGNNDSTMGGKLMVLGHFDNIFWWPTIELDGQEIMRDGRLVMPGLGPVTGAYYVK